MKIRIVGAKFNRMDRETDMVTLIVAILRISLKMHWERELGSDSVTLHYFVSQC